ncbi:MAG TPA: branched-chain amino acid transferase, partial [Rhodospirillaceae bacterium]|nr:branched-chain amino acid transferase [Rhodospirillaceae bacterium]
MTEKQLPNPADGIAWMEGDFIPLSEAKIGVGDWGLVRSDATYDVVSV